MADVPVLYRFIATGQDSVASAFKGILATAQSTSKGVAAAVQQTERVAKAARGGTSGAGSAERAAQREADMAARAAKRAADAKIREEQRALAHVAAIRERYFVEEQRAQEKRERANARVRESRMKAIAGIGKDAALAGVGFGASLLGVVGQAAREGVQLQDVANRLSIASRGAGEKAVDPTTLRREFEAAALANPGVKATDVAAGAAGFVAKTGELGVARRFAGTFATVASASGASVEDISNAAADLFQKFDITSIEDMRNALAALTYQGKAGAFEIKDAAAQFAKMGAAAARFGVSKGAEGVKILGGLTQIARSSTGSPEQAATAVEATFRQLISKSKEIRTLGVNVFEKGSKSKTRDVRDVLVDTISKAKGSLPKLQEIFGDEGIRGISPLISAYNEASGKATGTPAEKNAAGIEAMRAALVKAIDAPGDWSEVVKDAAQAQKSASAQVDAAWESIKATVAQEAVPAIQRLLPGLMQLSEVGIGPAIVVFQALVEAAGDVVDAFKFLGLITPKGPTPEQKLQKAKEALANFDKAQGIGAPTAEKAAERARLVAAVDAADKLAYTTSDIKVTDKKSGTGQVKISADEFAKKYAEASGVEDDFWHSGVRADIQLKAKRLAENLAANPNDTSGLPGENEAQRRLRGDYASQMISQQAMAQSDLNARASAGTASVPELLQSAQALMRAAEALQRNGGGRGGSIVGD